MCITNLSDFAVLEFLAADCIEKLGVFWQCYYLFLPEYALGLSSSALGRVARLWDVPDCMGRWDQHYYCYYSYSCQQLCEPGWA